jgi:hypothetical protein
MYVVCILKHIFTTLMVSAEFLNVKQQVMHVAITGLYLAVVYVWSVTGITSFSINVYTITPSAQYCSVFYERNYMTATCFGLCMDIVR